MAGDSESDKWFGGAGLTSVTQRLKEWNPGLGHGGWNLRGDGSMPRDTKVKQTFC